MHRPKIPTLRRWRQEDFEFKVSKPSLHMEFEAGMNHIERMCDEVVGNHAQHTRHTCLKIKLC